MFPLSCLCAFFYYSTNTSLWEDQRARMMEELIRPNQTSCVLQLSLKTQTILKDSAVQIRQFLAFEFFSNLSYHISFQNTCMQFFNSSPSVLWLNSAFQTLQTLLPPTALSQTGFPSIRKYFCCAPSLSLQLCGCMDLLWQWFIGLFSSPKWYEGCLLLERQIRALMDYPAKLQLTLAS